MTTHLDDRIFPSIDYTRRDHIITDLIDIITCTITQEVAEYPIVFNNQFNDRESFDTHRQFGDERSTQAIASIMNDFARVIFKDPQTGGSFKPKYAHRVLFRGRPTRTDIVTVLFKRIENINIEEIEEVLPPYHTSDCESEYLKAFVTTTKAFYE